MGWQMSKFDLLVQYTVSATKCWNSWIFSIQLIHFSGQVRKYLNCPVKILTCPGQLDNGFVSPSTKVYVFIIGVGRGGAKPTNNLRGGGGGGGGLGWGGNITRSLLRIDVSMTLCAWWEFGLHPPLPPHPNILNLGPPPPPPPPPPPNILNLFTPKFMLVWNKKTCYELSS